VQTQGNFSTDFGNFLIQIIGIESNFRGKLLVDYFTDHSLNFIHPVGVEVSREDFELEIFHSRDSSFALTKRHILRGELGCALAHVNASKRLIQSRSFDYSLVFEDDVRINQELPLKTIKTLMNGDEPRILLLGWNPSTAIVGYPVGKHELNVLELLIPPTGTFAYAINKSAAQTLSKSNRLNISLADWPAIAYTKIKFFTLEAPVAFVELDIEQSVIQSQSLKQNLNLNGYTAENNSIWIWVLKVLKLIRDENAGITLRQIFLVTIFRDFLIGVSKLKPNEFVKFCPRWLSKVSNALSRT
jgi:hypothetical protein